MSKNVKLHPLYAQEYWKIHAFFKDDPTIEVSECDSENKSCEIYVEDPLKAKYLREVIKTNDLKVEIICSEEELSLEEKIDYVCQDNPLYSHFECDDTYKRGALMFAYKPCHWFSDDFFSPTGHTAVMPYQLAKDIFVGGVNFQTDIVE